MKTVILIIALLTFANTASALSIPEFVNIVVKDLTSLLDVIEDLVLCAVSLLGAIIKHIVNLLKDLLVLDIAGIVEEVIELIPNILKAVRCDCSPIIYDLLKVVKHILDLVVQLLVEEGSLLAKFIASLIEVLLGGVTKGLEAVSEGNAPSFIHSVILGDSVNISSDSGKIPNLVTIIPVDNDF